MIISLSRKDSNSGFTLLELMVVCSLFIGAFVVIFRRLPDFIKYIVQLQSQQVLAIEATKVLDQIEQDLEGAFFGIMPRTNESIENLVRYRPNWMPHTPNNYACLSLYVLQPNELLSQVTCTQLDYGMYPLDPKNSEQRLSGLCCMKRPREPSEDFEPMVLSSACTWISPYVVSFECYFGLKPDEGIKGGTEPFSFPERSFFKDILSLNDVELEAHQLGSSRYIFCENDPEQVKLRYIDVCIGVSFPDKPLRQKSSVSKDKNILYFTRRICFYAEPFIISL